MTTMEIDNKTNTIYINRGNQLSFDFSLLNDDVPYIFADLDVVGFGIYEAYGMEKEPIVYKEFKVEGEEPTDTIKIVLTKDETKFGNITNMAVTYWYEITLNGETVLGYDKDLGPKILKLYPEGSKPDGVTITEGEDTDGE